MSNLGFLEQKLKWEFLCECLIGESSQKKGQEGSRMGLEKRNKQKKWSQVEICLNLIPPEHDWYHRVGPSLKQGADLLALRGGHHLYVLPGEMVVEV